MMRFLQNLVSIWRCFACLFLGCRFDETHRVWQRGKILWKEKGGRWTHTCMDVLLETVQKRGEPKAFSVLVKQRMDAFTIEVWWNFDKIQIIFRVITGSSSLATILHSMEMSFDTGLVALESISLWKCIYYGMLRCHTLPSKENFPKQQPALWFLWQILLSPI